MVRVMKRKNSPPKPGEKVGPLGLPASYAKYQLVDYGFREGKTASGTGIRYIKTKEGFWEIINYPAKGYGSLNAPRVLK